MNRSNKSRNIAIVGCGPAGLSTAIALYQSGHEVTLFERFEAPQPVGSGLMLQPTGLAVLSWLGLQKQVELLGQRIDGMLGKIANSDKVVLDIKYSTLPGELYGVAIHRASLFHVLYEAVLARNIKIHTGWEICSLKYHANSVSLIDVSQRETSLRFDLVVDASGCQSKLLSVVKPVNKVSLEYGALWGTVKLDDHGFNRSLLEQRYRAASVMAGVLPCGHLPGENCSLATFFWSIKSSDYAGTVDRGIEPLKKNILQVWPEVEPLIEQIADFSQLAHAQYSHHTMHTPYSDRIVFVGDTAHATSPQLGQGANMALLDARALAAALAAAPAGSDFPDTALKDYARMRRTHVRLFQTASLGLTPLYQSDSKLLPWFRDTFFQPVSKIPVAARLMTSLGAGLLMQPVRSIEKYEHDKGF